MALLLPLSAQTILRAAACLNLLKSGHMVLLFYFIPFNGFHSHSELGQNPFDNLYHLVPHSLSDLVFFTLFPFAYLFFLSRAWQVHSHRRASALSLWSVWSLPRKLHCLLSCLISPRPYSKGTLRCSLPAWYLFYLTPQHYSAPFSTFFFSTFHSIRVLYVYL